MFRYLVITSIDGVPCCMSTVFWHDYATESIDTAAQRRLKEMFPQAKVCSAAYTLK